MFELFSDKPGHFLNSQRSISYVNEGKWTFAEAGPPLEVERAVPRKAHRLTLEDIVALCAALGLHHDGAGIDEAAFYSGPYIIVEDTGLDKSAGETLQSARAALGLVPSSIEGVIGVASPRRRGRATFAA